MSFIDRKVLVGNEYFNYVVCEWRYDSERVDYGSDDDSDDSDYDEDVYEDVYEDVDRDVDAETVIMRNDWTGNVATDGNNGEEGGISDQADSHNILSGDLGDDGVDGAEDEDDREWREENARIRNWANNHGYVVTNSPPPRDWYDELMDGPFDINNLDNNISPVAVQLRSMNQDAYMRSKVIRVTREDFDERRRI